MLSSLSSFLPSVLQANQEPKEVHQTPVGEQPNTAHDETEDQKQSDNMASAKKKAKKDKTTHEVRHAISLG